jgi:hypothetical protein
MTATVIPFPLLRNLQAGTSTIPIFYGPWRDGK